MNQISCADPYLQNSFQGQDFCIQRELKPVWDKVLQCSVANEVMGAFFNQTQTLLRYAIDRVDAFTPKQLVFKERETIYAVNSKSNPKEFILEWINHLGAEFFNPISNFAEIELTDFNKVVRLQFTANGEIPPFAAQQVMFSELISIQSALDVLTRYKEMLLLNQRPLSSKILPEISDEDLNHLVDVGLKSKGLYELIGSCSKDWGKETKKEPEKVILASSSRRVQFQ